MIIRNIEDREMGVTARFEAEDYPRKRFVVRVWKTCKGRLKLEKELEFDDFFDTSDAYFKIEDELLNTRRVRNERRTVSRAD